jgi:phosphatidylinositol-3-phosphatase
LKFPPVLGRAARLMVAAALAAFSFSWAQAQQSGPIVYLIVLENHNWTGSGGISGSAEAPYINQTLVPMAAVANNYFNPYGIHPSLPNYLWMEAGTNFGIRADENPSQLHLGTHAHLSTLLQNAGIPWRAYEDSTSGAVCPLTPEGPTDSTGAEVYQPRHNPYVYFDDVTNDRNPHSANCIAHLRPLAELESDINRGTIGRYNFVTPNLCHDGHDSCGGNEIAHIDSFLKSTLPVIFNSPQYKAGRVTILIVGDEAANGDGPIPFLALGHGVKKGYKNEVRYTHSSLLRTLEEIFNVRPFLGYAASSNDLRDLFTALP